jgi:hypothetical protein
MPYIKLEFTIADVVAAEALAGDPKSTELLTTFALRAAREAGMQASNLVKSSIPYVARMPEVTLKGKQLSVAQHTGIVHIVYFPTEEWAASCAEALQNDFKRVSEYTSDPIDTESNFRDVVGAFDHFVRRYSGGQLKWRFEGLDEAFNITQ